MLNDGAGRVPINSKQSRSVHLKLPHSRRYTSITSIDRNVGQDEKYGVKQDGKVHVKDRRGIAGGVGGVGVVGDRFRVR